MADAELFEESVQTAREMVKGVGKCFWRRRIAPTRSWIIGGEYLVCAGEAWQQGREHARSREETMNQQDHWRVLQHGFAVNARHAVHPDRLVLHRASRAVKRKE
jgi:hypothetical protein